MKRSVWIVGAVSLAAVTGLTVSSGSASAYDTYADHKLAYGVTGQYYWVDSHAQSHVGAIDAAPEAWEHYLAQVSYTRTTTKSLSRMDWYKIGAVQAWWGKTQFWVNTSEVNPGGANWVWNRIWLDQDFANCPNPKGTTVHEMGHAMGLDHVSAPTVAIMRGDLATANLGWTNPLGDDVAGINHLY